MLSSGSNGMALFDWGLLSLSIVAAVVSFATYRSRSVAGGPVADNVRAIKAVSWTICALYVGTMMLRHEDAPVAGVALVVLWLLAFSDIVAGLARIGARLQVEDREARRPPNTVTSPPHR